MWQTIVGVVVGLAAFLGALGVIAKAPPVRWLVRRNVVHPVSEWHEQSTLRVMREHVPTIVDEALDRRALTNGWGAEAVYRTAVAAGADVRPPPPHPKPPPPGGQPKETP